MTISIRVGQDTLNFPDNTPEDVIRGALEKRYGAPKAAPAVAPQTPEAKPSGKRQLSDLIRDRPADAPMELTGRAKELYDLENQRGKVGWGEYTLHNYGLGLSDEVSGVATALGESVRDVFQGRTPDIGANFAVGRDVQRKRLEDYERENPNASIGGRIAGGVMQAPLGAARAGAGLLSNVVRGAREGAVLGGLTGLGNAEGSVKERVEGGVEGAALGGALGGGLPLLARGVSTLARPIVQNVRTWRDPQGQAARLAAEALERDSVDPATLGARMADDRAANVDVSTIADQGGRNTMRLMRSARSAPGPGGDQIERFLVERQAGQGQRARAALVREARNPDDFDQALENVIQQTRQRADPAYQAAYAHPVRPTQRLQTLLQRPAMQRAGRQAQQLMQNEGINPQNASSTQFLDYVGRALNDMAEGAQVANPVGIGTRATNESRIFAQLKRQLDAEIEASNPLLRQARRQFADDTRLRQAMEDGANFWNRESRDIAARLRNATPAERHAYRLGSARALDDQLRNTRDMGQAVENIFGSPEKRATLRHAFPDQQSFNAFSRVMQRERAMQRLWRDVTGGSQTVDKAAELADAGMFRGLVRDVFTLNWRGAIGTVFDGLERRALNGLSPNVASHLADILTATNPRALAQAQQMVAQRLARQGANRQQIALFQRSLTNALTRSAQGQEQDGRP